MTERKLIDEELTNDIVGGNLTYTWMGGVGTCGLNFNHKWKFTDKALFEQYMDTYMRDQHYSDVDTLKVMIANGVIWK